MGQQSRSVNGKPSAPRAGKSPASKSPSANNPERPGRTLAHEEIILAAFRFASEAADLLYELPEDDIINGAKAGAVAEHFAGTLRDNLQQEAGFILLDREAGRPGPVAPTPPTPTLAAHEAELVEAFRSLVLGGDPAVYRRFIERLRLACVGSATHAAAQRVTDMDAEPAQCFGYLDPHAEIVSLWDAAGEKGTAPAVWSPVASATPENATAPTPTPGTIDATLAGVLTPAELAALHSGVSRYAAQVRRVREMIAAVGEADVQAANYEPDDNDSWWVTETVAPICATLQGVRLTPDRKAVAEEGGEADAA